MHFGHRSGHLTVQRAAQGVEDGRFNESIYFLKGGQKCHAAGVRGLLVLCGLGRAIRVDKCVFRGTPDEGGEGALVCWNDNKSLAKRFRRVKTR